VLCGRVGGRVAQAVARAFSAAGGALIECAQKLDKAVHVEAGRFVSCGSDTFCFYTVQLCDRIGECVDHSPVVDFRAGMHELHFFLFPLFSLRFPSQNIFFFGARGMQECKKNVSLKGDPPPKKRKKNKKKKIGRC
jgi:hypothetical protein